MDSNLSKDIDRRQFVLGGAATIGLFAIGGLAACTSPTSSNSDEKTQQEPEKEPRQVPKPEKILFAWEPTASTADYDNMRNIFADCIAKGAGIPCEPVTTTDYNVAIESISSGKVHMASLGAYEYLEVHKKNPAVEIAFVLSNNEGKLDQASYHSQVLVRQEDAEKYKKNGKYSLDDIKGKNYSFVSLSSTSGFIVPSTIYVSRFGLKSTDELTEPGSFFRTVLFGGSHVNSLYNVLSGEADLASCDDTGTANCYTVESGANGVTGSVYVIKEGLAAPLDAYAGQKVVVVDSFAVPAVPFCVNTDVVDEETLKKIVDYMCSSAVSDNPSLFRVKGDTTTVTKWNKTSDKVGFVPADDSYYNEFRALIGQ